MQSLWMIVASLLFAFMGVCVKQASAYFHASEIIFARGLIGAVLIWALAFSRGTSMATPLPWMHLHRSAVGAVAMGGWFYAVGSLPLATAMTLNYMSGIWIAVFLIAGSVLARLEGKTGPAPISGLLVGAVLAGFAGVVLMLRPGLDRDQILAVTIGVLSGLCTAFSFIQVLALSRAGEPETRIVFYLAVGSCLVGALAVLVTGLSDWKSSAVLWLLPIGVLAGLGQLCMTRAYGRTVGAGGTLFVANLQYSGVVFAAALGWLIFDDRIDGFGYLGIAVIVGSAVLATTVRLRNVPSGSADTISGPQQ